MQLGKSLAGGVSGDINVMKQSMVEINHIYLKSEEIKMRHIKKSTKMRHTKIIHQKSTKKDTHKKSTNMRLTFMVHKNENLKE